MSSEHTPAMVSRRTALRAGLVVAAAPILASLSGCGAAPELPEAIPLFTLLVNTAERAFASELGTNSADAVPGFVKEAVQFLSSKIHDHSDPELTWVRTAVPKNRLRAAIHALHFDDDYHLVASTVHQSEANAPLLVPAIFQLGLNLLTLARAGYTGQFYDVPPKRPLKPAQMNGLRVQHSLAAFESRKGNNRLDKSSKWTGLTVHDQHIDVDWTPSKDATEDCTLVVRKGQKPTGAAPIWDTQISTAIPYRYVFPVNTKK